MGRFEKTKGSNFEVKTAKLICKYFGLDEWQRYLPRTRVGRVYHSSTQAGGQLMGDLHPTSDMISLTGFRYPIECKHRKGWSLPGMLKHFSASKPYRWWREAEEEISPDLWPFILVFTQNNYPVFVLHQEDMRNATTFIRLHVNKEDNYDYFGLELLTDFLDRVFPHDTHHLRPGCSIEGDGTVVLSREDHMSRQRKKARKVRRT